MRGCPLVHGVTRGGVKEVGEAFELNATVLHVIFENGEETLKEVKLLRHVKVKELQLHHSIRVQVKGEDAVRMETDVKNGRVFDNARESDESGRGTEGDW